MRIVSQATTPTGEAGLLVECGCGAHPRGNRAIVREAAGSTCRKDPERIHGLVNAAWHPLASALSAQRFGPWRAQ